MRDGVPLVNLQAPWRELQASLRRLRLAAADWLAQADSEASVAEDSAEPPASDTVLGELHGLLARHDLDALSVFDAHGAPLRRRLGAERFARLEDLIGALDFVAAAALLQEEFSP